MALYVLHVAKNEEDLAEKKVVILNFTDLTVASDTARRLEREHGYAVAVDYSGYALFKTIDEAVESAVAFLR